MRHRARKVARVRSESVDKPPLDQFLCFGSGDGVNERRFIDRLAAHARDLPSAMAQTHGQQQPSSHIPRGIADDDVTLELDADAQRTMVWIASLGGPDQ